LNSGNTSKCGSGGRVGQVVGQFERVEKSAAVIERWVAEYLEATEHLDAYNAAATA
jgi:NAD(P)H-dependent flavin oxidoreductase YrpB (nitropropane dioxygenase family)